MNSDWDSANETEMMDIQKMIEALMPVFNWTGLWMVSFNTTILIDRPKFEPRPQYRALIISTFEIDLNPFFENIIQINILLQKINTCY